MSQPDLQTHEAKFFLYYTAEHADDGSALYWALGDLLLNHADGYVETGAAIDGEDWDIRLNYSPSGIAPRASDSVSSDTVYEYDLTAEGYGERKVSVNFSPRWPNIENADGEVQSFAWDHLDPAEGVEAHVQGSNIALDDYPGLIRRLLLEVAAEAGYDWRREVEPFGGRIYEVERYLRLNYDQSKKLVGDTGVMMRLMMVLAEEQGAQAIYELDNEGRVGNNHRLKLESEDVARVFPRHHAKWGRQLKSYLPREAEAFAPDDTLYHPKVGALYRQSLSRETVDWDDRDEVVRELDETVLNALAWSDVPLDAGRGAADGASNGIFVADDHFSVEPRMDTLPIYPDPTPELEAEQDSILFWALNEHTRSDRDIVETLATDGGQDLEVLKQKTGWSDSTIYRALHRLEGAIESKNGHFRFASRKLAREFRAMLEQWEEFKHHTIDKAERLLDVEIRSKSNSAFERWLAEYGAEFVDPARRDDGGGRPVVRIDTMLSRLKSYDDPFPAEVVREMVQAWTDDLRDADDIRYAQIEYRSRLDGRHTTTASALL